MSYSLNAIQRLKIASAVLLVGACTILSASAQTSPVGVSTAPSPGKLAASVKQAVEVRQAVYTLIGNNFRIVGDVLQGRAQYDAAEVQKRVARVAFLTELAGDAFPDVSNAGLPDSKAKADIWTNRADFDKRLKDFQEHAKALVQVNAKENGATDAFKAAANALAQDCKGCHEKYKEK